MAYHTALFDRAVCDKLIGQAVDLQDVGEVSEVAEHGLPAIDRHAQLRVTEQLLEAMPDDPVAVHVPLGIGLGLFHDAARVAVLELVGRVVRAKGTHDDERAGRHPGPDPGAAAEVLEPQQQGRCHRQAKAAEHEVAADLGDVEEEGEGEQRHQPAAARGPDARASVRSAAAQGQRQRDQERWQ